MITTGRLASKVKSMGSDSMGRWCYHLLEGKASVDLLVVSIYQSCAQHGKDDGMTFHTQQRLMLSQMDRPTFDPRPNFFIDLKHFLHQHVNTASTPTIPIILGDWNEECTGTSTSQKLCDSFGLVDLWKFCNPALQSFKTYHRGHRRIDFALTTLPLASLAINMVYKPFFYRTSGDHRGFYIDFDFSTLFSPIPQIFGSSSRGFTSKDRKAVTTY